MYLHLSVKFVLRYFSLDFNGIVLLSFLYCSLLGYRSTADFYILTIYLETLLNSSFLVDSVEFSLCKIMSSVNNFTSFFSIWMPSISFLA